MANNKKFIVKNGLQSEENVVIGTTTDNGSDKLQVTGSSEFTGTLSATQSDAGTATVSFTNDAGPSAIIAEFKGDSSGLDITNFTAGDYSITNTNNGIRFYNNTDGIEIVYNGAVDIEFSSDGIDFKREPTYNGFVFWNAGNDGAGSGLDADLIDGLDSTQFLRSDEDDVMNGSLTITGDLTVSGNTTYINTEEILLSDNIITLNADFTSGAPTEDAGIEIERGSEAKSSIVWDETNDYFRINSAGTNLGRIITTADEARNGGNFDADTLDQLDSTQFLRSDQDDLTSGNLTVQGNLTVGDGNGTAYLYLDGAGTNGTIASSSGEIGFLNASFNYALKVKTDGDVEVRDNIFAQEFIDLNNNTYKVVPSTTSVLNDIALEGQIIHNGDTDTYLNFNAPNSFEVVTGGSQRVLVNDSATQFSTQVRSADGTLAAPGYSFTSDTNTGLFRSATDTLELVGGGVSSFKVTNTYAEAPVEIRSPIFKDSDNASYYGDFAGTSVLKTLGVDDYVQHNGDTDTRIAFSTDTIGFETGGTSKLTVDTAVTASVDVVAPRFVDSADNNFYADPAGISKFNSADFYSGSANNTVNIGINSDERLNFSVTDSQAYIRYIQDEVDGTNHSVNFEIVSNGIGLKEFKFNNDVNVGTNSVSGGFGLFSSGVYAPVFYDYDDENYYADFSNTGVSLNYLGSSRGGAGSLASPAYSFAVDTNTGMYRYSSDVIGFSAGGNDEFRIYNSYTLSPGSSRAPLFYDSNNTTYYGNFAGTSQMSRIDIDDYIRHRGDTNNYFGFGANDTFRVWTGGVQRLNVDNDSADFSVNVYAPRYYDSNNGSFYLDPASTSVINNVSVNDYVIHNGDTNTYIGFDANDQFGVWTNGTKRVNIDNDSADFTNNVYAPRFYTNDYLYHNGDNSYIGFDANDNFGVWTSAVKQIAVTTSAIDLNLNTDVNANLLVTQRSTLGNGLTRPASLADLSDSAVKMGGSDVHLHVASLNATGNYAVALQSGRDSDDASFPMALQPNGGNIGIGTLSTDAVVTINKTTAQGNNPFVAGSALLSLGDVGTTDLSIRTDSFGNIYYINDNGGDQIWYDSGASGKFAIFNDGNVVAGSDSFINQTSDATTNFIASPTDNKFHVSGSISVEGKNSVVSIYNADGANTAINEATFLGVNELGFSAGGGFYMDETTRVKVRGNKDIFTTGNYYGGRYYDGNNENYYVDPAGDSQMNTIDIDDYIRHRGDTNTYIGFDANDRFRVWTGGTLRASIDTNSADFAVNVYAPRYYDSNNNSYYLDPAADSQLNTIDIDDYVRHRGNTDAYFGWSGNNTYKIFTAGTQRFNLDNNSADFAVNVYAPRYYDSNDNLYYVDPASTSRMNNVTFGIPGNGSNTKGRFLSIEGNTDASGEGSARIFFAEHNSATASQDRYGMSLVYQGGSATINSVTGQPVTLNGTSNGTWALIGHDNSVNGSWAMRGPRNASYVEARAEFRAPIFRDSNNTAYYVDPASTSVTNVMRANLFQVDGSTYTIDSPSGDYGSIKVGGAKGGWAGYAINDDWVFMSNGTTNMGLYNDTRNEWSLYAQDNNFTRLYANGVHQIGAENGYGYAPTSMRSPIFYDSNNTAYYGNFGSGNTGTAIKVNGQYLREGFNTSGGGTDNYLLKSQDANHYIWATGGSYNWGMFWATNSSSAFRDSRAGDNTISFVGNGQLRALVDLDNGDIYSRGEMYAGNYNIDAGNESVALNPAYGAGTSEQKLFDGNLYWEKRAIDALRGNENSPTGTTSEYVKSTDAPGSSSYVLRTSAYRDFYSDMIEVEPGEEIYGEMWVKYISGSGGLFYYGVEQYDKDKRPIASNTGCNYFVAAGTNTTTGTWRKFSGHLTIPTSHTAYGGSDGGGVRYVRIRVLMNYNSGGALREFTAPILVRTNVQSRVRTDQAMYSPIYYDANDTGYYLDPNSTSKLATVDANVFRDRNNTARYMDPASGGNVQGTWNWNNGTIANVNNITFADPGPNEGLQWLGGNDWRIYESPDNLSTNTGGNLQFVTGSTMRGRIDSSGDVWAGRYMRAQRFYDSNDGNYYADPAGSSIFANLYLRAGGLKMQRNYNDNSIWFNAGTDQNHVLWNHYYGGPTTRGAAGSGGFDGMYWNTYAGLRIRGGSQGANPIAYFHTTGPGNGTGHYVQLFSNGVEQLGTRSGYGYAPNQMRSPIFYDSNDTAYYGNFASTSRMNAITANIYSLNDGWDIYDDNGETLSIRSNNSDHGYISFRDSNSTECGRIEFDDDGFWGLKTPSNEWALYMERDARVYTYYNGTWEERTNSGYMEARGSYRAPIFYDSNDTGFYANPNGTSRFRGLTTIDVISSPGITGYASSLVRRDNRTISPSEDTSGQLKFGFTSWANNNSAPYADYLHLRSYTDSSGGSDNLVMFKKSGIGMRIWQQTWNSTTAYATYRNVPVYNENPDGSGNNLYAARFYDEDNTAYYADPAGRSIFNDVRLGADGELEFVTSSGNIRGYMKATETNDEHLIIATSGGEDIAFKDGGFGGDWNLRIRGDGNTYFRASARAPIYYDSNNTGYYVDPSSSGQAANLNGYVRANDYYARNWFRNDNSSEGLYNQATAMHWYSTGTNNMRLYAGSSNTVEMQMMTSGGVMRGYVYANNSNDIGFLRENGSWIFRTRQSYAELYGDFYANIFYDRNNSAYYSNPASTSRFNEVRANYITNDGSVSSDDRFGMYWSSDRSEAYAIYREPGSWTYRYPDLRIAFHTGIKLGANAGYNGIRFYNDYNMAGQVMSVNNATDPLGGNNVYVNNSLQAGSSLRAPIFYDSNNTTYYVDPASSGTAARLRGTIYIDGDNNDTWLDMKSASSGYGRIRMRSYAGDPMIEFSDASNNAGQDQVWAIGADDRNRGSFVIRWGGSTLFPGDWTSHGSEYFQLKDNGYLSLSGGEPNSYRLTVGGVAYASASMRSPIFYDSNNTGYYVNPASFSNLNSGVRATEFYARNWFRNDNAREGMYNQSTGAHSYSYQGQYWAITGNNNSSSMSLQLRAAHNGTMCRWMYGDRTWSGDLNAAGQWQLQTRHQDGYSPTLRFIESGNESWTGNIGNDAGKLEYHSNRFYLEAGGNSSLIVQFRRNGSNRSYIDNNGLYVGTATSARWADLAERYRADDIYEPGTVMGMDLDSDAEITIWREGLPMVGVISTNPAVQMNDMGIKPDSKSKKAKMNPFIALKGRIPCKVSGEDGAIKKGMWLIPDPEAVGLAKGVPYGAPGVGSHEVIGIALCDSKDGEVEVKV